MLSGYRLMWMVVMFDLPVVILQFTDRQYERIVSFRGRARQADKKASDQFDLF